MALYGDGNLKTEYVEAQTFIDTNRVSFELKGHHLAYLPNMRITDLAVVRGTRDSKLNRLAGIYSVIKNARLMDGATELSSLRQANRWLGFKNQNNPHEHCQSFRSQMTGAQLGFEYQGIDRTLAYNGYVVDGAGDSKANSGTFTIDLKELFPVLKKISHLPTDLFRNLRVEIEFESLATPCLNIFVDANQTASAQRPLLAVDYLDNAMIVKKMEGALKSLSWLEIEEDSFHVPQQDATAGATQGSVQAINEKSNGFQNKHVERLLIAKEIASVQDGGGFLATNIVRPAYGPLGSYACYREKLQIRMNGKNILPREGLTKPNEMLSYLVDTWGEQCMYPQAHTLDGAIMNTIVKQANEISNSEDFRGAHSYFGLYLGEKIDDLQINYERTGLQDTGAIVRPATEQMRVHLFAEVKKGLQIQGGKYNIVYL